MTDSADPQGGNEIERLPSLVPGLDTVLSGGFLRGGLYMIQGVPGMGKTMLASQIIYSAAAQDNHVLFVTVLGENHGRMMAHLRPMRFFDESIIPEQMTYISGYDALETGGLPGLAGLIRREVVAQNASLLVLDDVSAVEARSEKRYEMKRFTHEMQTLASATDCTIFMLTTVSGPIAGVENTMVDGLIELKHRTHNSRSERRLVVHKLRGSTYLEGEHAYRINREGITLYPRMESLLPATLPSLPAEPAKSFGVASLDAMFGGGLPSGTLTTLVGGPGVGKTTLGLHFLSGCTAAEPGLFFGCYESPEAVRRKAAALGLNFGTGSEHEHIKLIWVPLGEYMLDELAHRLLHAVRSHGARRLFIDGVSLFQDAALEPDRIRRFWSSLSNQLRGLGVTTLHTLELPELVGPEVRMPITGIASLGEVMVLMRYVELQSQLCRLISIMKIREGAFDPAIREFHTTDRGIVVGERFVGAQAVLSGMAREARQAVAAALEQSRQEDQSPGQPGQPG